ncbi:hypothetical protein B0H66DRAFT_563242 [Apodospora peruviana]|uniref:DUF1772-domain-containing protein n=1 Tax=Apodospora peruviana TaxID=516989 RepID=A0AAE0HXC9_9PEZI|nr:hypothetical protein B0H66DRAFT_563242 [Apodospora peruviana]
MTTLAVTKGLAIAASFLTGGASSAVSLVVVPTLLAAPHNIAVKQFKLLHSLKWATHPSSGFAAALLHGFVAYRYRQLGLGSWSRWATSAALMGALLPWALGAVEPVSRQLVVIAGTSENREGGTEVSVKTEALLRKWDVLNGVKGVVAVIAGAIGLWTVLDGN